MIWTSPAWISTLGIAAWSIFSWVQGVEAHQVSYTAHLKEYEQMGTVLGQIQKALEKIDTKQNEAIKRDMTLQGDGKPGDFGTSDAFVMINMESDARIYENQGRVKVINLSRENRPERVLSINGTVSDRATNTLITFSRRAADLLQVEGSIKIRLEPVLEE